MRQVMRVCRSSLGRRLAAALRVAVDTSHRLSAIGYRLSAIGYREIGKSGNREIGKSGNREIGKSENRQSDYRATSLGRRPRADIGAIAVSAIAGEPDRT